MLILASANGTMRPSKNAYSIIGKSTRHLLVLEGGRIMARAKIRPNSHRADWPHLSQDAAGPLTRPLAATTVLPVDRLAPAIRM